MLVIKLLSLSLSSPSLSSLSLPLFSFTPSLLFHSLPSQMTDIMNTSSPSSESGKNVILKVSENSDAQLEDLFKVLNAGDGSSQNSRRRGLPSSLYEEPNKDEQPKTNIIGPAVQLPQNPAFGSGRNSSHSRVISLPADLNRYPRGDQFDYHNIPLPPGWEIGKTAESHTYFIK